jgi:arylsulfatase A-like enzyme
MHRTNLFIIILAPLLIIFLSIFLWRSAFSPGMKRAKDFNIVLISIDTCRADFIGAYGNPLASTPNIDSLAQKGVLFENYYSTINVTLGAHSSIFTGLYPRNHGVGRNDMRLNNRNLTMAEFLSAKGYTTAAFVGSFALASVFGVNQGFQEYEENFYGNAKQYVARDFQFTTRENKPIEYILRHAVMDYSRSAEDVNKAFFQWLDKTNPRKFFAFVHYYDPHFPYNPPKEWYLRHLKSIPQKTPFTQEELDLLRENLKQMSPPIRNFRPSDIADARLPDVLRAMLALYLSEIEYCDSAIGKIVEKLEKENLRSNTILIVTADHGENLIDHWEFGTFFNHGLLTHETEMRIPLVVSCPGLLPERRRVQENSSEIDLFPTLMDLLGFAAPKVDGVSLVELLFRDRIQLNRPIFSESTEPFVNLKRYANQLVWINDQNAAGVRWKNYKYIVHPLSKYEAVFDILRDRSEQKNLLSMLTTTNPDLVSTFRRYLRIWRSKALPENIDKTFQLNKEDQEKLRSLGYLQ